MPAPSRSSLLVRVATVTLSLGVLGALVTQASLSTGCARGESPAPSAQPEPRAAAPAATPGPMPATPQAAPSSDEGELDVGDEMFGTSKSGRILRPKPRGSAAPAGESGIIQNAPPSNANAPR